MKESIKNLYKKVILEHSRNPHNEGSMDDADLIFTAYNPLCGDKYTFYFNIENNKITDASFMGFGCSISKASSSILVKKLIGSDLSEARSYAAKFVEMLNPDSSGTAELIGDDKELQAFAEAKNFPERIQCASMGWEELNKNI